MRWVYSFTLVLLTFSLGCNSIDSVPLPDNNPGEELDTNAGETGSDDDYGSTPDSDDSDTGEPSAPLECDTGLTQCGTQCVDISSDVSNCGLCGRTCVIPNADASCEAGDCALLQCDDGFFDADQDITNGCELMDACIEDVSCDTSCGSQGSIVCDNGTGSCAPPAELCNGLDDDCDGNCEVNLAGCRTGIHRGYGTSGHFYSGDMSRVSSAPYGLEANNYFFLYAEAGPSMRPLFLCHKGNGRYMLSTQTACEIEVAPEETLGFIAPSPLCGAVPIYRLYHPGSDDHFYTLSANERDNAINAIGYLDEGILGYVWPTP